MYRTRINKPIRHDNNPENDSTSAKYAGNNNEKNIKIFYDADDSSDEEKLKISNDRSETCVDSYVNFIREIIDYRFFLSYIAHFLGRQLLYSKEVNQIYYEEKKNKFKINKRQLKPRDTLRNMIEGIILKASRGFCYYLRNGYEYLKENEVDKFCESTLNDLRDSNYDFINRMIKYREFHLNRTCSFLQMELFNKLPITWQQVINENKYYLPRKFGNVMKNVIQSSISSVKRTFYFAKRPTLGNYNFYSGNSLTHLVNLRLLHRTIRRETRNLLESEIAKGIHQGNHPKKFHFSWSFFKDPSIVTLERISIFAGEGTCRSEVENGGSYKTINHSLTFIKEHLRLNDSEVASWIREILKGDIWGIENTLDEFDLNQQDKKVILENLSTITYLLFGCEVSRNPSSLIIHQMALDLIIYYDYQWKELLTSFSTPYPPLLPMARRGIVELARKANNYFSEKSSFFGYKYDLKKNQKRCNYNQFENLWISEGAIIDEWLLRINKFDVYSGKDNRNVIIFRNEIEDFILDSIKQWFGQEFTTPSNNSRILYRNF